MAPNPSPFFVVGVDRSGTTLLRLMLNRHPRLAVPRESDFITTLLDRLPIGPLSTTEVLEAYEIIVSGRRFPNWHVEPGVLEQALRELAAPSLAEVIDTAFRLEVGDGPRWGDKTPKYITHMPALAAVFPRAQFVHLVRDGRDVSESLRRVGWHGRTVYERARYWADSVRSAEAAGRALGATRYLRLSYEDLVIGVEPTLRTVCGFLGVDYHPRMLSFHEDALSQVSPSARGIHTKLGRASSPHDVQRWKHEARPYRVYLFEALAGNVMEDVGQQRHYRGLRRWLLSPLVPAYRLVCGGLTSALAAYHQLPRESRLR